MRHIVATLIVAVMLVLVSGSVEVHGQDTCSFVGGFARVRDLVGADKIGACLEDEHFNAENGNTEQRTTGGLMVWRKADNFTAFTDGGTTWVNGPDGLQSRPNNERFAWETDPVTLASANPAPAAAAPPPTMAPLPTMASAPIAVASPVPGGATAAGTGATAPGTTGSSIGVASPVAVGATPTKAATPTPAVSVKFTKKPSTVETGADAEFAIETNQKKGSCALTITYNDTDPAVVAGGEIDDDGKCEFKWTLAEKVKTGKAKAEASVSTPAGVAATDYDFTVKKGNAVLAGSLKVDLELVDGPDDEVKPGESFKVTIETNYEKEGICNLAIAWPKVAGYGGEQKTPDGSGRCSWTVTVPADITKGGEATMTLLVRKNDKKNNTEARSMVKKFEVKK